jgi:hypothetical protein
MLGTGSLPNMEEMYTHFSAPLEVTPVTASRRAGFRRDRAVNALVVAPVSGRLLALGLVLPL